MRENKILSILQQVIISECKSLLRLSINITDDCVQVISSINKLKGRVVFSGIGKSGYIAQKISSSFASIGVPSIFVHPAEASHGDLGMITKQDLLIILSNSGSTSELHNIVNYCLRLQVPIASMTMKKDSWLAQNSDFVMLLPAQQEASELGAPTNSTIMMLSLGDAMIVALHKIKNLGRADFGLMHPGGNIGSKLCQIGKIMHDLDNLPSIGISASFHEVMMEMIAKEKDYIMVKNENNLLAGIITKSNLRNNIKHIISDSKAADLMDSKLESINKAALVVDALEIMEQKKVDSLIVEDQNKIVGLVHIDDISK